jgi:uncharacterized protein YbcC (UPF0753/DUF2309 family)
VGRRALTRGLFLDRRAFLVSYDPEIDPDGDLLGQALAAAGPVGAGINLAYNFSCIDNLRHGAGSKLPHNVTGLVGVMDGAGSDLRTGLPRQMVELHEPMRLLMVCEATPATLARVLEREPRVAELVTNGWVQLVSVHPSTGEMQRFIPGQGFDRWAAPPTSTTATATRSLAWYRWHDGSLPPALIAAGGDRPPGYAEPVHPGNNRQGSP